jgi:hypothetical protein
VRAVRYFACLPVLLLAAGASRGLDEDSRVELRAFLAELAARNRETRTLEVRFRQEKKLRILRRPRLASGELYFAGGKLAIITRDPGGAVESRLLHAAGEMKIYYPALERLEIFPAGEAVRKEGPAAGQEANLLLFTQDWEGLEERYELRLARKEAAGDEEPPVTLSLEPREKTSAVKKIEMTFAGHRLIEYLQEEVSGDRVRMEILAWKVNEEIPAERFRLEVPPGTRVTRAGGR